MSHRQGKALLVTATIAAVATGWSQLQRPTGEARAERPRNGQVTAVTDGDTLRVRIGGRTERVRLLGIDTPETHRPGVAIECGGPQASAYMRRLAPVGSRVTVSSDPTQDGRDRYGRLLGYVVVGRRDAGAAIVAAGWAEPYVYNRRPVQRASRYAELARSARNAGRGVWGRCGGDFHSNQTSR